MNYINQTPAQAQEQAIIIFLFILIFYNHIFILSNNNI